MLGKAIRMSRISRNGKILLLAMDQGLEHGPSDFNSKNINPDYVLDIAKKGRYTAMILHKGVALKYFEPYAGQVPLLLKLNGRTNIIPSDEIYSSPVASVDDAIKMGADAVGYTIYAGSPYEAKMFSEFAQLEEKAREYGIPVVMWSYPRGKFVKEDKSPAMVAYAARVALELGADAVKVNWPGTIAGFSDVVRAAQKMPVLSSGGSKLPENQFIEKAKDVMRAGGSGLAVGRNVWQSDKPLEVSKKLAKVVFG
ncbi:MAG: fructose-bisphosphate aldolase [Candidatus Micrarchaeota archaeon]|nr:fructose-bisphosphate aldolase [Candidatus Micrarchaeota archaeon]